MKAKCFLILFLATFLSCKTSKDIANNNADIQLTGVEKNYLLSDSGSEKYYLVKLIRKLQSEGKLGEVPMLIVDGDPKFYYYKKEIKPANIEKSKIKSIEIVEGEECAKTFGAAGKFGLIRLKTYGEQQKLP